MKRNLARSVTLLLGLSVAACGSSAGTSPDGSEVAPASTQTQAQEFVQRLDTNDSAPHLLARQFFNQNTEFLALYEPAPGTFKLLGGGNPAGGRSAIPLRPNSATLSAIWHLLAAPGQAPPPELSYAIEAEQQNVGARPSSADAGLSGASSASHVTPQGTDGLRVSPSVLDGSHTASRVGLTADNFCSDGGFLETYGANGPLGQGNTGPFWQDHRAPIFLPLIADVEGYSSNQSITRDYSGSQVGYAFCPSDDSATYNGTPVSAGFAVWEQWFSGFSCPNSLSCNFGFGHLCTDNASPHSIDFEVNCAASANVCNDGNLTALVMYAFGGGSGCE